MARAKTPIFEAFHARYRINPLTGCWIWTGAFDKNGYGQWQTEKIPLGNGKYRRTRLRAPRISYEIHFGAIPDGKYVLHRCDIPACVNPDHLWLGTPKENSEDMARKGRVQRGEKQWKAKLTEAQVLEIRNSSETLETLAKTYEVSAATIHDARMGRTWSHLDQKAVTEGDNNKFRKQSADHLSDDELREIGSRISRGEKLDVIARDFNITNAMALFAQRMGRIK